MRTIAVLLAAAALAAIPPASAAERYAGVAVGAWVPDTGTASFRTELDTGLAGELRAGWRFGRGFGLEAAAGGWQAEHSLRPVDVSQTTLHSVTAWYVLLSVKAFVPLGSAWQAGAGAGFGHYTADLKAKEPPATERRATETDNGFHLGVYLRLALTEHAGLNLEYRQVRASPGDIDIDGAAVLLAGEYHY